MTEKQPGTQAKTEDLLRAVLERTGDGEFLETLKGMSWPDLQTVLLHLYNERVSGLRPTDLLRQFVENRFLQPSRVDQREFVRFDAAFYEQVEDDVEVVELSPVAPLGANSVLAKLSQMNVLSTVRNVEVMADTVTSLALHCARRRKEKGDDEPIFACTSQRETRAQQFDESTKFLPHFRGISMVSSHLFDGQESMLSEMLTRHIRFYLRGITQLTADSNYQYKKLRVMVSSMRILNLLMRNTNIDEAEIRRNTQTPGYSMFSNYGIELPGVVGVDEAIPSELLLKYKLTQVFDYLRRITQPIVAQLSSEFLNVEFAIDLNRTAGIGYYQDICIKVTGETFDGYVVSLADGGETDWTKQILQNKKERCIASGMGAELFLQLFQSKK